MTDKRFNPEKAQSLMRAERKKALPPDEITEHLNLQSGDTVADLGAGNGYFTIPIAKKAEKVYAVDIEPKMLEMLRENAGEENLDNIHYMESDLNHIKLEDESVNKIIIAFVMHEVPDVDRTLSEIKRILKPGGQLLLLDWEAIETESGPPLDHRISSTEANRILERYSFDTESIPLNPANYAVRATPK
ncbi:class I SAM-dependent methyltransferase [Virgibacillus oceani]|uniref:Methyltransferase type 11 n=1 Tax=Virgibacillus oceani TaxID=1479511 RepID=A0A917HDI0_9BACI|nr:class I SAM-dependent methyltransferase [Virgibacillus oceani]GGG75751.1 methyltransferase type 11 [Virgibacillus oceani]